MSLFIQNNSGPIYSDCTITIHNGQTTVETPHPAEKPEPEDAKEDQSWRDILPIPGERRYTEVRRYIQERCRFDAEFKQYVDSHSRVDLCKRLTNEFGWDVDEHHLGVNMNRHRQ